MSWPLSHDFNEAVQTPQLAFQDPDLKGGETVVGATGLPLPRSGNFADVYQVRGADGREWAVKCFTRPVVGLAERYARISDALIQSELPFTVGFTYLADGIRVGGAWRPIVKMEWVEGLLLNQVVRDNAGSIKVLTALGAMWAKLCKRLREANVAHADLQHGNVLLVPGSRPGAYGLKLIDYDGMWVKALANTPSGESGHPSFQHPGRASGRVYSPDVDRFPHLAIAAVLRGMVAGGSALWDKYDNGDNLLFTETDYKNPASSSAMRDLWNTDDPVAQALVGRLAIACGKPVPQTPWLDQIAPDGDAAPLDDATRREAAAALGISLPVPAALPPEPAPVAANWSPPPLPPEPAPEPAFEAVPEPAFTLDPEPVVTARRVPLKPTVVIEEDEPDVELVQEGRRGRPSKKGRPKDRAQSGNGRVLLFAGGGLLLLLGGVIAGVMIGGGSKPAGTAQKEPVAKDPSPKVTDEPRPKPTPKVEAPVRPPVDPPVNPPAPPSDPAPPAGGAALRWSLPTDAYLHRLVVSGRRVFGVPITGGRPVVYDVEKKTRWVNFGEMERTNPRELFPLAGGGIASWTPPGDVRTWEESGQDAGTINLFGGPPKPAGAAGAALYVSVSPNGRFSAIGWVSGNPAKVEPGQSLGIHEPKAGKALDLTWSGGRVLFTADSSRVLIADYSGKGRWHKLPSGAQDGAEWDLGPPPGYRHEITSMSADGSVLGYLGSLDGPNSIMGATLDGKTGAVLARFRQSTNNTAAPVVSADGKRVAVHRPDPKGFITVDVADARTGAPLASIPTDARVAAFAFSDDSKALAVSSNEPPTLRVYDLGGGAAVAVAPPDPPVGAGLRPKWSRPLPANAFYTGRYVSEAGRVVLGVPSPYAVRKEAFVCDLKTGAPRPGFVGLLGALALTAMDKGRVASQKSHTELVLWDGPSGQEVGKLVVPELPPGGADMHVRLTPSPNGAFVAAGWQMSPNANNPTIPLRVFDVATKKAVVETDWRSGGVFFTADSSRVLVAEYSGRCRWFKLPDGAADGEWQLDGDTFNEHVVTGISADGSVLAYGGPSGCPPRRAGAAVLDGATGKPVHRFPPTEYEARGIALSADGRRVAVQRRRAGVADNHVDVADARTGAVVGTATFEFGASTWELTADGSWLVVFAQQANRMHAYDLTGGGGAAVAPPQPPVPPTPVGAKLEVREKWTADLPAGLRIPRFTASADSGTVVGVDQNGGVVAVDAATGKPLPAAPKKVERTATLYPLSGARFAVSSSISAENIPVVNFRTGESVNVANVVVPGVMTVQTVSPDLRVVASGQGNTLDPIPFKMKVVSAPRPFLEFDWVRGYVHYTADSKRALVAEHNGRCRWVDLKAGRADPEWSLEPAVDHFGRRLFAISADGSVLLYDGLLADHKGAYHVVDGATGKVLRSLHGYENQFGGMSADGRLAVFVKRGPAGRLTGAYIVHLATGAVAAEVPTPAGSEFIIPTILPNGSGMIAHVDNRLVRYDFVPAGGAVVAPPPVRPQPVPGAAAALKERWSVELKAPLQSGRVAFDADGQAVAVMGGGIRWTLAAVDARTGKEYLPLLNRKGNSTDLIPLDKGRFGYYADFDRAVTTWTPTNGKEASAPVPGERGGRDPFVRVSPNARYMFVSPGVRNPGQETPEVPLQVLDLTAGGPAVQHAWRPGRVLFTADSSRALVVDDTDRFRWFKLPGVRPDGEWKFDRPPNGFNAHALGMSAKGEVVLFEGTPTGAAMGLHLLNGKDGTVLHTFPAKRYHTSWGAVSEDGRMVALVRNDGFGVGHTVEVVTDGGDLVASVKLPAKDWAIAFSWKGRALAIYERDARRLTAYDLPEPPRP